MADEKRDAGERGMEPIEFENEYGFGIISNNWSQGILPAHSAAELADLRRNIERDGCIDPVITWNGTIVDGHKRAEICDELGKDFPTHEMAFEDRDHAVVWVVRQQKGRRNVDDVGSCEMAEKIEPILQKAAEGRMFAGNKPDEGGTPPSDVPPDTDPPPSPYGGLLDDVLYTPGTALDKAAEVVGIGGEKYRRYKEMKGYYTGPSRLKKPPVNETKKQEEERKQTEAAWKALPRSEKKDRRDAWEEILGKMRGPAAKSSVGAEYREFKAKIKGDARKSDLASRVAAAKAALQPGEHEFRPWGADGPTWCLGKFQKKANLALIPEGGVKLLLCDPPYGQAYDPNDPNRKAIADDGSEEKAARILRKMLKEFKPKLAKDAHVVFFVGVRQEPRMRRVLKDAKYLTPRSHIVWIKDRQGAPGDTGEGFAPYHERALHATQGNPGFTGKRPHDAFEEHPVKSPDHLTPKPVALLRQIIEVTTTPGELVADPFGGTASTLVAALSCGRRAWGAELEPEHYNAGYANLDDYIRHGKLDVPEAVILDNPRTGNRRMARPSPEVLEMMAKDPDYQLPEPSLEDRIVPKPGAITWGWA